MDIRVQPSSTAIFTCVETGFLIASVMQVKLTGTGQIVWLHECSVRQAKLGVHACCPMPAYHLIPDRFDKNMTHYIWLWLCVCLQYSTHRCNHLHPAVLDTLLMAPHCQSSLAWHHTPPLNSQCYSSSRVCACARACVQIRADLIHNIICIRMFSILYTWTDILLIWR